MSDTTTYTFKIDDFTPKSMPFGRLVEYYLEIKKMLGVADNLHLVDLVESSHGSAFAIDRNYEATLVKRLMAINEGTAPKAAVRAQSAINAMLREDGTSGTFFDSQNRNVISFPGKRQDDSVVLRIRDAASFTGELYHIAGTKGDAKIRISTENYGVVFCTTTRDIAKALRDFLFEEVKVSGRGTWTRNESGAWDIDEFSIADFAPIKRENLREAVDRLRSIDVSWPDDVLGDIRTLEEKNGYTQ
ncbi:hypothetical protein [Tateyamaria sp. SN3-11]|uniref:hypothetical protein n=1 Tax=Tateyamaria sp. SN3-11 TaxID=3092147 RepID=UPI0039EA1BA0